MTDVPQRHLAGPFTPELNAELAKWERIAQRLVASARLQFVANYNKGKRGWNAPLSEWHSFGMDPLDCARNEAWEAKDARGDKAHEADELGDALNFLVFEAAASRLFP